jgi:hypothetical protein
MCCGVAKQLVSDPPNPTIWTIEYLVSDPPNPTIWTIEYLDSDPPNPTIWTIEYWIPIRLIRLFGLLNIGFRST